MKVGLYNFMTELGEEKIAELIGASISCTECPARTFCKKRHKRLDEKLKPLVPEYRDKELFAGLTDDEILEDLVNNEFINTSFCEETMVKYFKIGKEVGHYESIANGLLQSLR